MSSFHVFTFVIRLIALFIVFTFASSTVHAETTEMDEHLFLLEQIDRLELDEIREYWEEIATEYGGYLPEGQKGTLMEFLKGEKKFSPREWGIGFVRFLLHEVIVNGKLMGSLILLTVFCMVLQSLQNAFEQHTISKVAYGVTYIVLIIIALNSFKVAIQYASEAVTVMNHFMIALLPLLLALMAAVGNVASVAIFHPLIMFLVYISGSLISFVVLPLLFFSAVLSIVSTLTDEYKVTKLASLLRVIAVSAIGIFLTVFLGVISVQGAQTAVVDGITVRTAKFITGNFVPVVGRMFTDAVDTVLGASLILKNTVGIAGLGILIIICAFPALKVLSIAIIFHLSAAILQPLGGGPVIECLSIIGKSITYVFAAMAIVCLMFFLALTVMIISGNVSFMLR